MHVMLSRSEELPLRPTHHSLHYVLAVIFKEDAYRARLKKAARNLSATAFKYSIQGYRG